MMLKFLFLTAVISGCAYAADLAQEVRTNGWILFSAPSGKGDWDLWVSRPDGSSRRNLTNSPESNEGGARVSPDKKCVLFYRMDVSQPLENNEYGVNELVVADIAFKNLVSYGEDFPWATWGEDSKSVATLHPSGVKIIDLKTKKLIRDIPRNGIVAQLSWAPDGSALTGTANGLGEFWNIGSLDATGKRKIQAVSETDRYNCTPDWLHDSKSIIYARGIIPAEGGFAELWKAAADGRGKPELVYADGENHIYGAADSPDGKYYIFTRSAKDMTDVNGRTATIHIIRAADAPMIANPTEDMKKRYKKAKADYRLRPRSRLGTILDRRRLFLKTMKTSFTHLAIAALALSHPELRGKEICRAFRYSR